MEHAVYLNVDQINAFCALLRRRERSEGTIIQYRRCLERLMCALPEGNLSRDVLLNWRTEIIRNRAVRTVNCMIATVNAYLEFAGVPAWKLKSLKCQRKVFSEDELT